MVAEGELVWRSGEQREALLFGEGAIEEPGDYEGIYEYGDREERRHLGFSLG